MIYRPAGGTACLSLCISVCVPACLSVYLLAYLPASPFACLFVCLPPSLHLCRPIICLRACPSISACVRACLPLCISPCVPACLSVYTCLRARMLAWLRKQRAGLVAIGCVLLSWHCLSLVTLTDRHDSIRKHRRRRHLHHLRFHLIGADGDWSIT